MLAQALKIAPLPRFLGRHSLDRMRSDLRQIVNDAIAAALARAAIAPGSLVLVGLSGGADSVALLNATLDLRERFGLRVAVAHLNHRIRAAESDRDEAFVRAMCARLGVHLIVEQAIGLDAGLSNLEERAREVRHDFLNRAADSIGADRIALAHHSDDQAETVMIRLLRGAGAAGLGAMAEAGPGRLIRPMLALTRVQILAYLCARKIDFVEDSTNSSPTILRNRVRSELLPMLEREYAPGISRRIAELSGEMRAHGDLADTAAAREMAARGGPGGSLDVSGFARIHPAVQAAVIRMFIADRIGDLRRIGRAHVEAVRALILDGGPSAGADLPGGWRAVRSYNLLRLAHGRPQPATPFRVPLQLDGVTVVEEAGYSFHASAHAAGDIAMPRDLSVALFDAAKIQGETAVRNFIRGDIVRPLGMRGHRKVNDIFIDGKLERARRSRFPIVALGNDVLWLPGLTRSQLALVTKATETVVRIEAHEIAF
jgi:tRNA(Ile)-lysidine synthase